MNLKIQIQFAGPEAASALLPAAAYVAVRTLAKLLAATGPSSAFLSLLAALVWFASAIYLYFVVTWQRDDNWLGAGLIIAATLLLGGVLAEFVFRMASTGSLADGALATLSTSLGLAVRAILIMPLAGGMVAGGRWLTTELRRSSASA